MTITEGLNPFTQGIFLNPENLARIKKLANAS